MLRHDLIHHPPQSSSKSKSNLAVVKGDLEKKPLENFTEEELKNVCLDVRYLRVHVHYLRTYTCTCNYRRSENIRC